MVLPQIEGSSNSPSVPRSQSRKFSSLVRTRSSGLLHVLLSLAALVVAALFLLQTQQARAQGAPNFQAAFVTGTSLVIIFSELLDSTSVPAASQFTVTVDGGTGPTVSSVAVEGAEVKLTLATAIAMSDANVLVAYSKSTNNIQDTDGDEIPGQMGLAVNNHTGATNSQPTFTEGNTITLTVDENTAAGENVGSPVAATDADSGDVLEYELETGVSDFTLDTATGQLKASAALDYESGPTSYVFVLFVTDNKNQTGGPASVLDDSIVVTVNVNDVNEGPDITSTGSSHTAISAEEGTHTNVVLATYAADDPENDSLTWTTSGPDAVRFDINTSGRLTFQVIPDYENPVDANMDGDYNVTVNVTDSKNAQGGNSSAVDDSIDVVVTVTNIDEPGTVTLPNTFRNGTPATAALSDIDGAVSGVTWQWSRANTLPGTFNNISGTNSASYTPVADDIGKHLKVTAMYTDPQGPGKSAISNASGAVLSGNTEPTFNEGPSTTRMVGENRPGGTHVGAAVSATDGDGDTLAYDTTGPDASSFTIVGDDGRILLKNTPGLYNYEVKSSYSVTVTVTDNKDAAGDPDTTIDDTIDVTINLINEDDPGTVTLSGDFQGGFAVTATLGGDEDGTPTNVTWQWSRGNTASGPFTDISGATSASYTPVRADEGKFLRATASYTDPQGPNKSAEGVSPMAVVRGNEDPQFDSATATRNVDENSGGGTHVGAAVSATDGDGDPLEYDMPARTRLPSLSLGTTAGYYSSRGSPTTTRPRAATA